MKKNIITTDIIYGWNGKGASKGNLMTAIGDEIGDMGEFFIKSNINSINTVYFAKTKEDAKIPSKRLEDAGYDIYACFDEEYIILNPLDTKAIPTGICSSFSHHYEAILKERGSTGIIGLKIGAGVIDSGFRNEWKVVLTNCSNKIIIISKLSEEETLKRNPLIWNRTNIRVYPYTKAVAQLVFHHVPELRIIEESEEYIKSIESDRGLGCFGSSGK